MGPAGETVTRPRTRVGKYLVTGRIGRGGMGMVYRGWDEVLEREVALKTLTAEGTFDEESRRRFEIEAKAAARLQHPNILTVFELGEDRGVPFIAMELLPGSDLEALLRSGEEMLLQERLDVVIQVCRGLAYAHEHRIVHRDVKPSNVRVLDDGTVKIMDFGIAKLQGTGITKSGMMVGTVHYMSPEQVRGLSLDGRSDVFSAGVILYELLAGRRPFPGETATDVLYRIVHEPAAPLGLPQDLGPARVRLQEALDRALAKDPGSRFATARDMAEALGGVLRTLPPAAPSQRADQEVAVTRRLLKEGRVEESLGRLRDLVQTHPRSLEARRALRAAARESERRLRPADPGEDFPELETTFQAPPTRLGVEATVLQTTRRSGASLASGRGWILGGVGAGLAVAAVAAVVLLREGDGAAPPALRLAVRSTPTGAAVLLDGRETGVVTDGELTLPGSFRGERVVTFRKEGYRELTRRLSLPVEDGAAVSATLEPSTVVVAVSSDPPGAGVALDGVRVAGTTPLDVRLDPGQSHRLSVSLEGHSTVEVPLEAGKAPGELRVSLEPAGPLGSVAVSSGYPLDVLWRGRVLARGQTSPRVQLPRGRQLLTLQAPSLFLRSTVTVDVGAATSLAAPALGTLNVRATPDNCEVFVDGASAGFLPILERPVAAGPHTVTFKWPDGARLEERLDVLPGRPAFAMGRKDSASRAPGR